MSDSLGRRRPLLVGISTYALSSLLCALVPSTWMLIALRLVQGMAGASGIVIGTAIVRDLYTGAAAARFFSLLMILTGLAPILGPILGGQLLRVTSWRGLFVILALIGILLLAAVALGLRETLEPGRRRRGGAARTVQSLLILLRERKFLGYVLPAGLAFAAMFAYISGSPYVLQDLYGVSPQTFSFIFAVNSLGLIASSQVGRRLAAVAGPFRLLLAGLCGSAIGGTGLLLAVIGHAGLPGILPSLFVVVSSIGLVLPNGAALALASHPDDAGSASAVFGVARYVFGGLMAPVVGVAGANTALPMAATIAALGLGAIGIFALLSGLRG